MSHRETHKATYFEISISVTNTVIHQSKVINTNRISKRTMYFTRISHKCKGSLNNTCNNSEIKTCLATYITLETKTVELS